MKICVYGAGAIGGYLGAIFDTPGSFAPVWWLLPYVLFVAVNALGAKAAFRLAVILTSVALAVLVIFGFGAVPHFSWDLALAAPPPLPADREARPESRPGVRRPHRSRHRRLAALPQQLRPSQSSVDTR